MNPKCSPNTVAFPLKRHFKEPTLIWDGYGKPVAPLVFNHTDAFLGGMKRGIYVADGPSSCDLGRAFFGFLGLVIQNCAALGARKIGAEKAIPTGGPGVRAN